jgi:RNA polymerase sigma-70 factor, ECF subfamily
LFFLLEKKTRLRAMAGHEPSEQFVRQLSDHQSRLYAYVLAILGNPDAVADVLQDTNVTLWRKAGEFAEGSDFGAWARRVAYFEVLAYRKRRRRERHIFDSELLREVADMAAEQTELVGSDLSTLHYCMQRLSQADRALIEARYAPGGSVKKLAQESGKSPNAISLALHRIRSQLADCMEASLRKERSSGAPPSGLEDCP